MSIACVISNPADLQAAAACIKRLKDDALSTERRRSSHLVDLLNSVLLWRKGAKSRAAAQLKAATREILSEGRWNLLESHQALLAPIVDYLSAEGTPLEIEDRHFLAIDAECAPTDRPVVRYSLTDREVEVLRLAGNGDNNKVIARQLGVSENTIKYHLKRAGAKMQGCGRGRIELAQRAKLDGLFA